MVDDSLKLKKELAMLLDEREKRLKYNKYKYVYFQDQGTDPTTGLDISRHLYDPHLKFMKATADYRELAFIASNRVGKSETGSTIITAITTGDYHDWWEGKRFPLDMPLEILILGKTNTAVRDVAQKKLVGSLFDPGTGMIPKEYIFDMRKKPGNPDALLDLYVKNKIGTIHHIQFLSYEIDDDVVMGREIHCAWFDEECLKTKLYNEVLMRTMTTKGFVFTTFTPLDGYTTGIQKFIPNLIFPKDGDVKDPSGKSIGCYVAHCGWDHAPHLTEESKLDLASRYTGAELIARTQGIPTVGAGQIYPYTQEQITCEPFPIPAWWPRAYGLDFGWDGEAAVWGARDPDTGCTYIYSEYYAHQKPAHQKIADLKERISALGDPEGEWMWGAADPSGGGRNQDGLLLLDYYRQKSLNLLPANNSLSEISKIQGMFETGLLKVFKHNCPILMSQLATYKYDDNEPKPARRQADHLPDSMRYLLSIFDQCAMSKPDPDAPDQVKSYSASFRNRNPVTGY